MVAQISPERETAQATYPAELRTVGDHTVLTLAAGGDWIAKPAGVNVSEQATHIQMQALVQNVRYTIDESVASATHGFQLAAGAISLVPVPNGGISVFPETAGAIVQYQFVR
ncbi:MAG: hypothetical protein ACYSWP_12105 [Planctomycetota bacterium]|jgi:hypothetical protein